LATPGRYLEEGRRPPPQKWKNSVMLYLPANPADASPPSSRPIRGRYLAHNRLSKTRRAFLGVDIKSGKVQPFKLTDKQIAALVGVSVPYLAAAQRVAHSRPDLRSACETGLQPLLKAIPRPGRAERMARMWVKADADERQAFVRLIGCDAMFDAVVAAA
jgi:hypothetical protein